MSIRRLPGGPEREPGRARPREVSAIEAKGFASLVGDALTHLHDPLYLQTHALARLAPRDQRRVSNNPGQALRQCLLDAIEAMRPGPDSPPESPGRRCFGILQMRFVDGLDVLDVLDRTAISRRQYYRELERGVAAVASLLRERWGLFDRGKEPPAGGTGAGGAGGTLSRGRLRWPGSLPSPLTTFVGREREVAQVQRLLAEHRLVTLSGPPGTGKTRLAIEVASQVGDGFADGVHLVSLAPVSDYRLVLSAIAQALAVREQAKEPLPETLKVALRGKESLLVLDNFEQVVEAAPSVAELLVACPGLRVLVTSRTVLNVYGEQCCPVPPLVLPERNSPASANHLAGYEAVRLFVERARAARPDFALTDRNALVVAEVCRRLDGLPLAIELAASRITVLSPEALLARLEGRLRLLTAGPVDRPERQQTLRAAIDWSHDLLDVIERRLFRRLGIFAGGWTLEAAEAICGDQLLGNADRGVSGPAPPSLPRDARPGAAVLDGIASLTSKSLLQQGESVEGEPRFLMLETIREYALERLVESGETDRIRLRHAEYFLDLAERAEPELGRDQAQSWLTRLEAEHDNLRAALRWALGTGRTEIALRFVGALWRFWRNRDHLTEGRAWLTQALAGDTGQFSALRARALLAAGRLAFGQTDLAAARVLISESLTEFRTAGDRPGTAAALHALGAVLLWQGDFGSASASMEECLAIYRELGDRWGVVSALYNLYGLLSTRGEYSLALPYAEECLAAARELGSKADIAAGLRAVGQVALGLGDYDRARALLEQSLATNREFGYRRNIAECLLSLADVALRQGHHELARARIVEALAALPRDASADRRVDALFMLARLAMARGQAERCARWLGVVEARNEAIGQPLAPNDRADYEWMVASARASLGEEGLATAWALGRTMPLEEAIVQGLANT